MWIERTIYTTAYKLPGILRWFEVKSVFMVRTPCRKPARYPLLRSDPASSQGQEPTHGKGSLESDGPGVDGETEA